MNRMQVGERTLRRFCAIEDRDWCGIARAERTRVLLWLDDLRLLR